MRAARRARDLVLLAGVGLAVAGGAGGCTGDCCTVDSFPIALARAPLGAPPLPAASVGDGGTPPDGGALVALAGLPGASASQLFPMVIDTGSPFTILAGPTAANPQTNAAGWNLYQAGAPLSLMTMLPPLRATFRGWDVIGVPLYPAGAPTSLPLYPAGAPTSLPLGVLGADLLRGYSVEFRFGARCPDGPGLCSFMTFWGHLDEDASLLEDAGYAVVTFTPFGGGEITAEGDPDFLGLRGPLDVPATRVVLRACAVPDAFSPQIGAGLSPAGCTDAQDALNQATGVDLSLLVDTGVGPLVLTASAWARVVAAAALGPTPVTLPLPPPAPPTPAPPPLYVATWPTPIDVLLWATIPRFVLINLEAGPDNDPGPCVELGRSRRTEIVSYWTVHEPALGLCGARCDIDPNNTGEAANSAAYLEIGGQIPVAVISDDDPFLQGLRFDVLPEGPELDGLVGANALGRSRLELDYLSSPARAVFSCETDAPRDACWAAARCPQLPDHSSVHYCFGLGPHELPAGCNPDAGIPPADGAAAGSPDAAATTDAAVTADAGTAIP
jgi:hypothetical protein